MAFVTALREHDEIQDKLDAALHNGRAVDRDTIVMTPRRDVTLTTEQVRVELIKINNITSQRDVMLATEQVRVGLVKQLVWQGVVTSR